MEHSYWRNKKTGEIVKAHWAEGHKLCMTDAIGTTITVLDDYEPATHVRERKDGKFAVEVNGRLCRVVGDAHWFEADDSWINKYLEPKPLAVGSKWKGRKTRNVLEVLKELGDGRYIVCVTPQNSKTLPFGGTMRADRLLQRYEEVES